MLVLLKIIFIFVHQTIKLFENFDTDGKRNLLNFVPTSFKKIVNTVSSFDWGQFHVCIKCEGNVLSWGPE